MVFKRENYNRDVIEGFKGGKGKAIMDKLTDNMPPKCRVLSEITLHPGCEIGYHKHENEFEIFHVMKGVGTIRDNDEEQVFKAGDTHCCYSGGSHGVINTGIEDMVILAIVITE